MENAKQKAKGEKMKKIYIEAKEKIINEVLEIVRPMIGKEVNAVDLNPELKEE